MTYCNFLIMFLCLLLLGIGVFSLMWKIAMFMACTSFLIFSTLAELLRVFFLGDVNRRRATARQHSKNAWILSSSVTTSIEAIALSSSSVYSAVLLRSNLM